MRTVGEVARLTGVTVRTLHHYDEIGLLVPGARSDSGYRLYSRADLERLQEILVWRSLGFTLAEVAAVLGDPSYDRGEALRRQREAVEQDLARLGALAGLLDRAIDAHDNGTDQEVESMFDGFDPSQYEEEARERWGDTDAYKESARRTASYGDREWSQIKAESAAIIEGFASLSRAGVAAGDPDAIALAERHRAHLARWFYACAPEMHRRLGEMYVADERFARNYERVEPGLAAYVRDAFAAAAEAAG